MRCVAGRLTLGLVALAAGVALAACEQDAAKPSAADSRPAGPPTPPRAETVRRCRTAVFGEDPQQKGAVTAGPLTLVAGDERRRALEPSGDLKVLALVKTGETVTVVVPEGERQRLSLLYDSGGGWGPNRPLRLSDGTSSVRFSACAQGEEWAPGQPYPDPNETQFNGGFFVRGAHCASLEVWVDGQASPLQLALGLGTGDRPCPATSP